VALSSQPPGMSTQHDTGLAVASASSSSGEGLAGHNQLMGEMLAVPAAAAVRSNGLHAPGRHAADASDSDDFWASILATRAAALPVLRHAKPSSYGMDVMAP
jgi:hypothetical protein